MIQTEKASAIKKQPAETTMPQPMRFGRQAVNRPPFTINELEFSSLPLSLAEEKMLAGAGDDSKTEVVDALLGVLTTILNARATGEGEVSAEWLMDNLTPDDLEGIVEYLRSGRVGAGQDD